MEPVDRVDDRRLSNDDRLLFVHPQGGAGQWSAVAILTGLVLASIGLHTFLAARYPLAAGLQHPGASWAVLAGFAPAAGLLHAAIYGIMTLMYVLTMRVARRLGPGSAGVYTAIVGGWLICSTVLLGAYPGDSTDIFDYLFRGRMLVLSGVSPLAVVPSAVANQPFYAYVHWTDHVDTYGPLWEYTSWMVAAVVGRWVQRADQHALLLYLTGYRLLAVWLAGACAGVIAAIVRRRDPALVPAALVAWLWNPLLLTATAVGAHNDMLLLLFMLLALLWFQRERWELGLFALGFAAHVKLTALLILPLLLAHIVRRSGWRRALCSSALAVLALAPMSWLLYAPLGGWATLPRMLDERVRLLANSFAYAAYWLLQRAGWREVDAWQVTTRVATMLFVMAALPLLWRFWRARPKPPADENAHLWRAASVVTLLYLLIGSFWFQHWYVLWALAPAVLLPERRLARVTLPLCSLLALWLHLAVDFTLTPRTALVLQPSGALMPWALACGWLLVASRTTRWHFHS